MSCFQYRAYGLSIDSDFALPELAPVGQTPWSAAGALAGLCAPTREVGQGADCGPGGPPHQPDVTIRAGSVSETLDQPYAVGVLYRAAPGRFLLSIPGIARYLALDGRMIVIDRAAGADDADVRVFLLASVFGALLHQRGVLPLHGSAVAAGPGAVLFLGASVSGKST